MICNKWTKFVHNIQNAMGNLFCVRLTKWISETKFEKCFFLHDKWLSTTNVNDIYGLMRQTLFFVRIHITCWKNYFNEMKRFRIHRIYERLEFQRDRITICGHQSGFSKRVVYESLSNEQRITKTTDFNENISNDAAYM